jgi:peptide/nickel transport system ATP-binding protein
MSTAAPLLRVDRLSISARRDDRNRTIVRALDLELLPGETVGVVGESGSGKSLTARALIGLLPAGVYAQGRVEMEGQDILGLKERDLRRLRGGRVALLLQDPFTMLNPLMKVGDQVVETARNRRSRGDAVRRLTEVGISDPAVAERYPFQLSGGMQQRVAIAAALASDPEILIADEPSTALDVTTQRDILALLRRVQEERGMGLILITHDLRVAFSMCQRIYVLYAGSALEHAPSRELESEPLHPYTLGLLLSEPSADRRYAELPAMPGSVPAPDDVEDRCPFEPRCPWSSPECSAGAPPLRAVGPGRTSACVRIERIRGELVRARRDADARAHAPSPASTSGALLRVERLSKTFVVQGGTREVAALRGVSLEVGQGESVGLVGESGSGKTTLARCIVGLEKATAGQVFVDDVDVTDFAQLTSAERRRQRRNIQMIFQDPYSTLNPARTIEATLREAIDVGPDPRMPVAHLLGQVGLPASYAPRKPAALSGGERQRVAIARSLALSPRLIVCDEPVSALDVSVQAQILNLFKSLRDELGVAYLFITHDLAVVRQIVDRVYVLYRGEVVEEGLVDHVLDSPRHAYTKRLIESIPRDEAGWLTGSPSD